MSLDTQHYPVDGPGAGVASTDQHGPGRHAKRKSWGKRLTAALTVAALALGGLVAGTTAANAAEVGNGIWFELPGTQPHEAGYVGNYVLADGVTRAYCIDYYADHPGGDQTNSGNVSLIPARDPGTQEVTGQELAEINFALSRWGQTSDDATAAAVQLFIWDHTIPDATSSIEHLFDRLGSRKAEVRAIYDNIQNKVNAAIAAGTLGEAATPDSDVEIIANDAYSGTVIIPDGWQIADLDGAVWRTGNGAGTTHKKVGSSTSYDYIATPSDTASSWTVSVSVEADMKAGNADSVTLWSQVTPEQQRLISANTGTMHYESADETPFSDLQFQPTITTNVSEKLVAKGERAKDSVTVGLSGSDKWREQINSDGTSDGPVELTARGTLYGPFMTPQTQSTDAPSGAPRVGTFDIAVDKVGTVNVNSDLVYPDAGYYVWVWDISKSRQDAVGSAAIRESVKDDFGVAIESVYQPFQPAITSIVREYNIAKGGRVFDTITVSGLPVNYGDFTGNGRFNADQKTITHTAYGPFKTEAELTADLDLSTAPKLKTVTTPAKNGTYQIGYTDADTISPTKPGYYVIVSSFAGSDRAYALTTSPADMLERFYVPSNEAELPVTVITQATAEVPVGQPFHDTALVQGSDEDLEGTYLVFEAFGPQDEGTAPECETPFFTSQQIPVKDGAGYYKSGSTRVTTTGNVYWIETLYSSEGEVLHTGKCGIASETTKVTEPESAVVTNATSDVALGGEAVDEAIVTGDTPEGAYLTFEAFLQKTGTKRSDYVCDASTLVYNGTDTKVKVDGAGSYYSEGYVTETIGHLGWIETLHREDGTIIHRGECGAPGETTNVVKVITKAQPTAKIGENFIDTAIVTGKPTAGSYLKFELYLQDDTTATCTAETLVFTSQYRDVHEPGKYTSPGGYHSDAAGTFYWVETLYGPDGTVIHRGECGAEGETTKVQPPVTPEVPPATPSTPPLALTGADAGSLASLALGLLVMGGLAGGTAFVLRKRRARSEI